jgi:hypothetical protein
VNLGHAGPPIIQRPWGSARSPPLAGSGEAEKTKDPAERRSGDGSARHEQPFNLLKPEAGVARPLVDLDPRRAVAQDCFQHGALHSAHAPTCSRRRSYTNMQPMLRDSVSWVTLLKFFERPVRLPMRLRSEAASTRVTSFSPSSMKRTATAQSVAGGPVRLCDFVRCGRTPTQRPPPSREGPTVRIPLPPAASQTNSHPNRRGPRRISRFDRIVQRWDTANKATEPLSNRP